MERRAKLAVGLMLCAAAISAFASAHALDAEAGANRSLRTRQATWMRLPGALGDSTTLPPLIVKLHKSRPSQEERAALDRLDPLLRETLRGERSPATLAAISAIVHDVDDHLARAIAESDGVFATRARLLQSLCAAAILFALMFLVLALREPAAASPRDVDEHALHELGADPAVLRGVIDAFDASIAETLPQLRAAAKNADDVALKSMAHKLKGAARQLGLVTAGEICLELERGATGPHVYERLDALEQTLARASKRLRQLASNA